MKKLLLGGMAALLCLTMAGAEAKSPACNGKTFNPATDSNWNDMFPITIAGKAAGGGSNPDRMHEDAVCTCPDAFGLPYIGVGVTFWAPQYVAELERFPGCLSTLGGMEILPAFKMEQSEKHASAQSTGENISRMQVNWYQYPVLQILGILKSLKCTDSHTDFTLAWMTPIDPTWQNDLWGAIFNPEGALFANPLAQAACAVDAVSASFYYPIDAMFWCAGSWGSVYPLTGNGQVQNSDQATNGLVLSKFIAKESRVGALLATTGEQNKCSSHYTPVWIKTQYRVDEVGPIVTHGDPVYIGETEFKWGLMPPANYPTHESSQYLIWNGEQCCIKVVGVDTIISFFLGDWLSKFKTLADTVQLIQTAVKVKEVVDTVSSVVKVVSLYAEIQANSDLAMKMGDAKWTQPTPEGAVP